MQDISILRRHLESTGQENLCPLSTLPIVSETPRSEATDGPDEVLATESLGLVLPCRHVVSSFSRLLAENVLFLGGTDVPTCPVCAETVAGIADGRILVYLASSEAGRDEGRGDAVDGARPSFVSFRFGTRSYYLSCGDELPGGGASAVRRVAESMRIPLRRMKVLFKGKVLYSADVDNSEKMLDICRADITFDGDAKLEKKFRKPSLLVLGTPDRQWVAGAEAFWGWEVVSKWMGAARRLSTDSVQIIWHGFCFIFTLVKVFFSSMIEPPPKDD